MSQPSNAAGNEPVFFGTDGIRDLAGEGRLTDENVSRVGAALARFARQRSDDDTAPRILIGRDPRPSGAALTRRLAGAMAAEGALVRDAGVLPTPALAWLTAARGYDLGCAVSASHNAAPYNGIKPFLGDGRKLTQVEECEVEAFMQAVDPAGPADDVDADAEACGQYVDATVAALETGPALLGLKLAVDLSAGAASATAVRILARLGIETHVLHEADTRPINEDCGTENPDAWLDSVRTGDVDGGLAFDGDADRVLIADETGALLDGDDLLAILAADLHAGGGVPAEAVVSTVMANLGLHEYLAGIGVALERTPVGDRNVAERMRALGAVLGGEPAGHVVLPRDDLGGAAPVLIGDGLFAGVRVLQAARRMGRPLSELRALRPRRPQVLVNVSMPERRDLEGWADFQSERANQEEALGTGGRFVIRYSGTEPLLRIMAEGREREAVEAAVEALAEIARQA